MLAENEDLRAGYERAHELYLAFRHEIALALEDSEEHIEGTSAGGMPVRVKCLHALLAQTLVMGEGATPSVIWPCPPSNMSSIRPYAVAQWKTKSRRWE